MGMITIDHLHPHMWKSILLFCWASPGRELAPETDGKGVAAFLKIKGGRFAWLKCLERFLASTSLTNANYHWAGISVGKANPESGRWQRPAFAHRGVNKASLGELCTERMWGNSSPLRNWTQLARICLISSCGRHNWLVPPLSGVGWFRQRDSAEICRYVLTWPDAHTF